MRFSSSIDFAACMPRTRRACFAGKMMMHLSVLLTDRHPTLGATYNWRLSDLSTQHCRVLLFCGALTTLCAVNPTRATANQGSVAAAIAGIDNFDTSGEGANRTAEHAARVQAFATLLRNDLAVQNKFTIVQLTCPHLPCSAAHMSPEDLLRAAQQAGARLSIYNGIHKGSTLIQWGKIEVFDLKKHELVLIRALLSVATPIKHFPERRNLLHAISKRFTLSQRFRCSEKTLLGK
jgi:hypothetical protein